MIDSLVGNYCVFWLGLVGRKEKLIHFRTNVARATIR
jgi:hypothetical protein